MASKSKLKPAEAAEAAILLAHDAKGEAAKFLLLRRAVELYAKAGDDDKTAAVFQKLLKEVKGVPPAVQERILLAAGRALPMGRRAKTETLFKGVRALVWAEKELNAARMTLKSTKKDAPKAHLRAGNALAVMGDWTKALDHLLGAKDEIASTADGELNGSATAEKLADAWWKLAALAENEYVKNAYRLHSVEFYRKALKASLLDGLNKNLAESRIAEVEKDNANDAAAQLAALNRKEPLYCVIDLSGGPSASSYPVSFVSDVSAVPGGTFNTDEYKTTKLVLRRIEPGKFMMQGKYEVTLTKPYYIGIFEITQKQHELVVGGRTSQVLGDTCPAGGVSWKWCASVVKKLRSRVKLDVSLPVARGDRLLEGVDAVLVGHPTHDLRNWIAKARACADGDEKLADYYETDARRIITVWAPGLGDYAARVWSGLVANYYLPRLRLARAGKAKEIRAWQNKWVEERLPIMPPAPGWTCEKLVDELLAAWDDFSKRK